jgi:prepilin-type N-terminal cleavage/methylation domain-containing protein
MNKNQDKGFTLVELLIVIVILGILATVTVFAVRGITDKGQENACAVDRRTLDTAVEAFYAQYQRNADTIDELVDGVTVNGTLEDGLLQKEPSNFEYNPATGVFDPIAAPDGDCPTFAA